MQRGGRFLACYACLALAAAAFGDETEREFRAAKLQIVQKMRDRTADTRIAAVQKLAAFPVLDAAKILLLQGLVSDHEDVRHASFGVLAGFSGKREICDYLQTEASKSLKRGEPDLAACAALGVLIGSSLPEAQQDGQQLLDKLVGSPAGPQLLVTLVDELGFQSDDASLATLQKLAELPPLRQFGPRRAYVQALIRMRRPEAVTALVQLLPTIQGEVRAEILGHLTQLSGQNFDTNEAWQAWWDKARPDFKFPAAGAQPAAVAAAKGVPTYYGLPLYGSKILFVIDTSTSMRGGRIVAAERELIKAIGELPDGVEFNILAFNSLVIPWQKQLVPSSRDSKQAAVQFVLALELGSRTNTYDALEAALTFDIESIYFLTDGAPTGGKFVQPAQILSVISQANRVRRITINTIGVGVGQPGNPFDQFLSGIARQDYGVYRRVDE